LILFKLSLKKFKVSNKVHGHGIVGNRRSHVAGAVHSHHPLPGRYGMILSAANALQCIVSRKENPQNCPCPFDFVSLSEEYRATAMGNMHKNFDKDGAFRSGDMLAERQTDGQTHTQTRSSQYFATAPAGQVKHFFRYSCMLSGDVFYG